MWATHPTMARKWEAHTPKGKRLPKRVKKTPVGLSENVANLFPPMLEGDYTWTKRASLAGAGMLLGLLVAKTAGHKADYVPMVVPPPPAMEPRKAIPSPPKQEPAPEAVPAEKPFQKEMLTLQDAKEFIQPSEGTRSKVYRDSRGKKTVGVGFNLNAPGSAKLMRELGINYTAVKNGRKLTDDEIDALFTRKVEDAMAAGPRVLKTFEDHPRDVQLAVVDMIYNLGPTGFSNLDSARDALERMDYNRAANNLERTAWYRQVGGRAENIVSIIRSAGSPVVASNRMHEAVATVFGSY
jgi:lysozyme